MRAMIAGAMALAAPAGAASLSATPDTLAGVWAQVQAGDTLTLTGDFGETRLANASFTAPVSIRAAGATFAAGLQLANVGNVRLLGGSYGSATTATRIGAAITVSGSSLVSITGVTVLGEGTQKGIYASSSRSLTVSGSRFSGNRVGITALRMTDTLLKNNVFTGMAADGMNIVGSQRVTASYNQCSAFNTAEGFHPDCIQMWSLTGEPIQSDIKILYNRAVGAMQGFTSFDPSSGSGRQLTFTGNYAEVSYPLGIACNWCFSSTFTDNTLVTPIGAQWTTQLSILGGSGNTKSGNIFTDLRLPPAGSAGIMAAGADAGGDGWLAMAGSASAVPEPAVWAQLIAGLGLAGEALRRRRVAAPQRHRTTRAQSNC